MTLKSGWCLTGRHGIECDRHLRHAQGSAVECPCYCHEGES
jgi:hypothetical protein